MRWRRREVADGRDWGAALSMDAKALHEAVAIDHPGPVNPADPGLGAVNDAQLARALKRAMAAKTYADYFYAIQEYTAALNDGHLSFGVWGATTDEIRRWPGFLTRYDGNGQQTVFASEPWSGVPLGARLVSCDGLSADELARNRVGSRFGRWNLNSQRLTFGALTFLDTGDPYVGTVRQCRFVSGGKTLNVLLQWRAPQGNLFERYQLFPPRGKATAEWWRLPDGTEWIAIPSFDGNPDGDAGMASRTMPSPRWIFRQNGAPGLLPSTKQPSATTRQSFPSGGTAVPFHCDRTNPALGTALPPPL